MKQNYKDSWQRYAFPESARRFSTREEIRSMFAGTDLSAEKTKTSGPVLLADGDRIVTNDSDEHWICVGETGSKKTRCFIRPLLYTLIKARESAIITDVKGELATDPSVRKLMSISGVNGVYLDFRNFSGDGYDLFENAYEARMSGDRDKASAEIVRMTSAFVSAFGGGYGSNYEPFWDNMASMGMASTLQYILEICAVNRGMKEVFNLKTLARFIDAEGSEAIDAIVNYLHSSSTDSVIQGLRGIVNTADRTRASISATINSYLSGYIQQESLMNMLSYSTFEVAALYSSPTFVFLIIPDETSAYNRIAGLVLDSMYSKLIDFYSNSYNGAKAPSCRVNWVCDEFCNVRINDAGAKISASRSRCMRFFLAFQSLSQLQAVYGRTAPIIIGNCKNMMFLQSSDPEMLRFVSNRCGWTSFSEYPGGEPLVSVCKLAQLKKTQEYKEALYIRENTVFPTMLPDGDMYPCAAKYAGRKPVEFPCKVIEKTESLSAVKYIRGLLDRSIAKPFGEITPYEELMMSKYLDIRLRAKQKRLGIRSAEILDPFDEDESSIKNKGENT